ncbi:MAG: carboxypeptidase-like regulatory domain-containing protein, partial [Acidobacteria bacterium]|nr:carboxypeptidase-like regulatory domain-containing protein [Acidobacteriota bacterium]
MFEFSPPGVAHRVQLRILSTIAVAALLLLFAGGPAAAQTFFGSIGGAVADATGAAIPAAPVTLRESATNVQRTGVTNAEGNYNFPNLPPGTYLVTVTAAGFKEAKSASIRLAAQQVYRFDLKLEVGDTKSTIEVAAESSSMNYETARISDVRPREQILSMPVNSRSTLPQLYMTSFVYDGD